VLKSFSGGSDGGYPLAGLTLLDNTLYGTTSIGGEFGQGTIFKIDLLPLLAIQSLGNAVVLSWDEPAFSLQSAPTVTGPYRTIPGSTSPYTAPVDSGQQFFRLIGN
jgi:uncharacterized repeat protein (TIGR03803 family)